jgi:hypothetical protein
MRGLRACVLAALLAAGLSAEPVYLSAHGKSFHKTEHCMSLSRAKHVYTAERSEAEKHGLHECSICWRAKKSTSAKQAGGPEWARETPETQKAERAQ